MQKYQHCLHCILPTIQTETSTKLHHESLENFNFVIPSISFWQSIHLSTFRANSELLQMESRMKRYVFDAPTIYGATCTGSMEIETEDGDRIIIIDTLTSTRISMKSIKMHGCGCYSVYSRKYGRGAKQMMFPSQTWSKKDVGFSRIRSIFKIQC